MLIVGIAVAWEGMIRRKRGKVCASRGRTKEDHFFGTHANQSPLKTEAPSLANEKAAIFIRSAKTKGRSVLCSPDPRIFYQKMLSI